LQTSLSTLLPCTSLFSFHLIVYLLSTILINRSLRSYNQDPFPCVPLLPLLLTLIRLFLSFFVSFCNMLYRFLFQRIPAVILADLYKMSHKGMYRCDYALN
jgi:hypothetical protein